MSAERRSASTRSAAPARGRTSPAAEAKQWEALAEQNPQDREELLVEAAGAWARAGDVEQALATYDRLRVAAGRVEDLVEYARAEGQNLAQPSARAGCAAELAARGSGERWPSARNGPCWCGSSRKDKKCHRGPSESGA
ncbi:hypothetical protein [Streptomyces sp. NPDC048111]|uniref:hypothetical protein n=1 Tax=Streptomyces sp. NPDC048111 TaxID=3365500 RepID=UPI0037142AD4